MQTRYLTKDKNRINSIYDLFRLFKFRCFETSILYKSKQNSIKKDKKTKEGIKRAFPLCFHEDQHIGWNLLFRNIIVHATLAF